MRGDRGSAVAEFVMVVALLTVLTLSVLQLAIALLVRNTLVDAAAEGARFGALADGSLEEGELRTAELIATAVGPQYARDVRATRGSYRGHPCLIVTVRAPLPLIGLFGPDRALEVAGHAGIEFLD